MLTTLYLYRSTQTHVPHVVKLLLCVLFFALIGCNNSSNKPDEGMVKYKITYLDDAKENPIINLLPSTMTMIFKDNNTIAKIDGFMGLFSFAYLVDLDDKKNATLVRIVDKKMLYEAPLTETAYGYDNMSGMQIIKVDETKEIAGYICKKAIVKHSGSADPIYLYYTYGIDIKNPNINNPFKDIDGVLLEFQVKLNNINMKFEAISVKQGKINSDEFKIPNGFDNVTKEEIRDFINSYMIEKPIQATTTTNIKR